MNPNRHGSTQADELEQRWATDPRWQGIRRDYSAEDVVRLRASLKVEHTLAEQGSESLFVKSGVVQIRV